MFSYRRNLLLSLLFMAGCSGGSGGIETLPPVDVASPPGVTVSGQVTKAPLDSAGIELLPIDSSGAASGAAVATATTQSDGSFTAVVPQGSGPLLIRTSGGSYVDEADREPDPALKRRVVLSAGEGLESLLPDGVNSVAVSIVTQAVLDKARRESITGAFLQQFTANRALATQAFGFDIVTTPPANPLSPDPAAPVAQRQYAMLLGGLANLVNRVALDAGLSAPDIGAIQAVVADFSDGRIDGLVAGVPVMVGQVPAGAFSINDEIARFRNNNFDAYASTPLLVVDENIFSQVPVPANTAPVAASDMFQINRGAALSITAPGVLFNDTDADGNALTATLTTAPGSSIAFSLQGDGSFNYVHDGGAPGRVTFEYVASDGLADSNIATVSIDVVNRVPVTSPDTATVAEGGSVGGDVLANDSDGDNDALTATVVDMPANGVLVLAADGTFTYTHDDSETTSDSFTYMANDGFDDSAPATVVITVTPVNDQAPVAVDDIVTVAEGGQFSARVLDNDTDGDTFFLTARLIDGPLNGQLAFDANGVFTYTHDGGETSGDSFTYVANDGDFDSNVGTVSVTVNPVNDAPVAGDDMVTVDEGGSVSDNVLVNDTDADNSPGDLSARLVDGPLNGMLSLAADGSFTYDHDGTETASDSFTYVANDGTDGSNTATVSITVNPVNDAPVANDDMITVDEGGSVSDNVLVNDTDADNSPGDLTARLTDGPLNGMLRFSADGSFTYDHDGTETTSDSFTYVVNDGTDDSNTATVSITVNPVNDAPVAGDDAITAGRGATVTMLDNGEASVLANDTDAEGDILSAQITDPPLNGQLSLNTDGTFSYTHDDGPSDSDSFTYLANDGMDDSNIATVSIMIVNTAPVAAADCIVVAEGATVSVVNDDCTTRRPLARSPTQPRSRLPRPTRGPDFLVGVSGTLDLLSQPPPSVEPFAFQNDITLPVFLEQPFLALSRPAVVNLTEPDSYGAGANDGSNAAGCLPINSAVGSALIHGDSTQGFPTWNGGFTLNQPLIGLITDSLDLTLSDSLMGLPSVIYPRDVDPTRGLDFSGLPGGDSLTIAPDRLAVSGIDFQLTTLDPQDPQLDVARIVVSPPLLGDLSISLAGGTPNPQDLSSEPRQIDKDPMPPVVVAPEGRPLRIVDRRRGLISLASPGPYTFVVSLPQVDFGSMDPVVPGQPVPLVFDGPVMTLSVTQPGVYEFVVSLPDLSLVVNGPLAPGLLANDTDGDLDTLTVTEITAQPMSGTVSIEPDGTFVYTHDGSEGATDSFGYRISDGIDTADGVVTVTVLPVDDPPVAADDVMVPIDEGGSVSFLVGGAASVLANDFDAEADNNTAELLDQPASASAFTLNGDGTFFYQHDGSPFSTSDMFTYVIESAFTGSCVARVTVSITPVNDPPTTSGIADVNGNIGGADLIDLFAAFDDEEDPDALLLFEVVGNTNPGFFGAVNIVGSNLELSYVDFGSSMLTVRATDTGGLFVETSFTVTVQ